MPTENLIKGHKKFRSEFLKNEKHFLKLAEKGQNPKVLWIGCSDSRVTAEFIMGAKPGDLFVMRNIANIVPPQNSGENCTGSVLEYAIFALKVSHIVVCGHTECGGMKALLEKSETSNDSSINRWLEYARSAKDRVLSKKLNKDIHYDDVIKENILLQKEHLLTFDFIKERYISRKLKIHKWLYELHTGKILSFNRKEDSWVDLS